MILVTGGAGFIGSCLIKGLNDIGREDIVVVDRTGKGDKWKNLRKIKFVDFIDFEDLFSVKNDNLWSKVQWIFHMGACSSTTEKCGTYLMRNNFTYSKLVFQKACELGVGIVYASSGATFGGGELGYSDDHKISGELRPLNQYGFSKKIFDDWVLGQEKQPPYWYGIKFFNVFGPNEYHKEEMRSMVHKGYQQVKNEGKVKLFKSYQKNFKDGEQLRDFIYIKDVVRALVAFFRFPEKARSGIYNLGTGKARSFKDLVAGIFKALEKEVNIEFISMPDDISKQYQYFTEAKMEKFKSAFTDFKFSNLEDSVEDYVKNYLAKDDPYFY